MDGSLPTSVMPKGVERCSIWPRSSGALREFGLDGWLLYDFRGSNVLARRVLDMESKPAGSRRFLYMIPATGEPTKLVHRIETAALDHLPGGKLVYLTWQELEAGIGQLVAGKRQGGDGVRAPRVQPLCLEGRCRNHRGGPGAAAWMSPPPAT